MTVFGNTSAWSLRQNIESMVKTGIISQRTASSLLLDIDSARTMEDWMNIVTNCLRAARESADIGFHLGLTTRPEEAC